MLVGTLETNQISQPISRVAQRRISNLPGFLLARRLCCLMDMLMSRRNISDDMGEDGRLAKLGKDANLVYVYLISITDEAGITPGEPEVIKGRCFPLMSEMKTAHIAKAIDALVNQELVHRDVWHGRIVLCFPPSAFQKHQSFRKDYRRKFKYDELSQTVWDKGLPGFRAGCARIPNGLVRGVHGSVASTSVTVPVTVPVPVTTSSASARVPDFEEFYSQYPRRKAPDNAETAWRKLTEDQKRACINVVPLLSKAWAGATEEQLTKCRYPATWLNGGCWREDPKSFGPMDGFNPRSIVGADGDDYDDLQPSKGG